MLFIIKIKRLYSNERLQMTIKVGLREDREKNPWQDNGPKDCRRIA